MSIRLIVLLVLLVGCKRKETEEDLRKYTAPTINDAGVAQCLVCEPPKECGKGVRLIADARVEAAYILGKPVVCDESANNGVTCWDTLGSTVWCPKDLAEPCRTPPPPVPVQAEATLP